MKEGVSTSFVLCSLVVLIINSYNVRRVYAEENLIQFNEGKSVDVVDFKNSIKVNFYRWDRKNNQKGEYIGTAELKNGKLTHDVKDNRLEKIIEGDLHAMVMVKEGGNLVNRFVTYKVGTKEHLEGVIKCCRNISCFSEIEK
ncbi:MAG: hypothetical protein P9X27_05800 [Candidatus Kaelpia aquatica]|nr:hypothetical protein [Candidatus Kaelpia aquatica]